MGRQEYREIFVWDGDHAIFLAINYWDGRAPVTLPGYAPIPEAENCFFFSEALGLRVGGHFVDGGRCFEARVGTGIYAYTVFDESFGRSGRRILCVRVFCFGDFFFGMR